MTETICYINTDLDLRSIDSLTDLVKALESQGISPLHLEQMEDGIWFTVLETDQTFDDPEANIAAMINIIDSLPEPLQMIWASCIQREFNIGYECAAEPQAFNQALSHDLLARIVEVGAPVRITLYTGQRA